MSSELVEVLSIAVKDEHKYIDFYEKLMNVIEVPKHKEMVHQIRLDCQKHLKIFMEIYFHLSKTKYKYANLPADNTDYDTLPEIMLRENFELLLFENLESIEFYRRIYFSVLDAYNRDMLFEIITDKQAIAIKMTYLASFY